MIRNDTIPPLFLSFCYHAARKLLFGWKWELDMSRRRTRQGKGTRERSKGEEERKCRMKMETRKMDVAETEGE